MTTLSVYAYGTCEVHTLRSLQTVASGGRPSAYSGSSHLGEQNELVRASPPWPPSIGKVAYMSGILLATPPWEPTSPSDDAGTGFEIHKNGRRTRKPSSASNWPSTFLALVDSQKASRSPSVSLAICTSCVWLEIGTHSHCGGRRNDLFGEIVSLEVTSVAFRNTRAVVISIVEWFSRLKYLSLGSPHFVEDLEDDECDASDFAIETGQLLWELERLRVSNESALARDVQHCARALQHLLPSTQRTLEHLTLDSKTMAALHVIQDQGATGTRTNARPKDQRPTPPAQPPPIFDLSSLSTLDIEVRIAARPDAAEKEELADAFRMLVPLLKAPPKGVVVDIKIYPEDPGEPGILLWPTRLRDGFAALKRAFGELGDTVLHPMRIRIVQGQPGGGEAVEGMRVIGCRPR